MRYCSAQFYRGDMVCHCGTDRTLRCGLGKHDQYCVLYWRCTADLSWCAWGIYWQDLYGSKAQTPVYHQ